ncbi:MAG TPA: hypothetical protein DCZ94_03415 [Lentisphaeria bacterium]|nr:MAG: hypothetical protein A2X48_04075 [Lentisphaerae bacterium GWF2_49_21]HBC85983.1 hypothetical protein [Lentisphaeria bacterium]
MRKIAALICGVAALAVVSGCKSTNVSQWSAPLDVQLKTEITPIIEVGEEITGTSTIAVILGVFPMGAPTSFADGVEYAGAEGGTTGINLFGDAIGNGKAAAAYNACIVNKADVIIAPRYTIETISYGVYKKSTFTVKGYKGVFKGIKK